MDESHMTLENACAEFEPDLVLYYYGDGTEAERRRVEAHLKDCRRCDRFLSDLRGLLPQMAVKAELPENFWSDYYGEMVQKLEAARERKPWWRTLMPKLPNLGAWAVPAFGTLVVVVLATAMIFDKDDGSLRSNQAQYETIPQEILSDSSRLEFFKSLDMLESLSTLENMDGTSAKAETRSI
jgi:hypothetical protein